MSEMELKIHTPRDEWEIVFDILKALQKEEKAKKTRIMHNANLNCKSFKRYFDYLLSKGFIANDNPDPECYLITENGEKFLRKLNELDETLR